MHASPHSFPVSRAPGLGSRLRRLAAGLGLASAVLLPLASTAQADAGLTKVTFGTNWFAEAEHGGFYQAVATGIYKKYGLDVTIKMGGPQVNGMQLLVSGVTDFYMGYDLQTIKSVGEGLPVTTVAASFQKDPQAIITHSWAKSLSDLKGKPVLVSSYSDTTFWPWLKGKFGFTDDMKRPYTFSVAPFLADKIVSQQGYITSEPYAIEKGGVKPNLFLMADFGYPPYAETLVTRDELVEKHPDVVEKFVKASMEGWKSYLENPAPGNTLIKKDNPQMTDDQLAFSLKKMKEYQLLTGGDAAKLGIGTMTDARWKNTFDFMVKANLVEPSVDYKKAYTLKFIKDVHVFAK